MKKETRGGHLAPRPGKEARVLVTAGAMTTFPACRRLSVVHVLMTCTRNGERITNNTGTEQRSGKRWSPEKSLWKAICHFKEFASTHFRGLQTCWWLGKHTALAQDLSSDSSIHVGWFTNTSDSSSRSPTPSSGLHINPHSVL